MFIASWNCRGAGSRTFPLTFKDIVNKYCIDIFCLMEPRISGDRANMVCRKLGFSNWIRVESTGFSGGIWLLWNKDKFDITYILSTTQLLHCEIRELSTNIRYLVTAVYGETNLAGRASLWSSLRSLDSHASLPWLVLGDFNAFLSPNDKLGGADPPWASIRQFKDCIDDTSLIEARVQGEKFTWEWNGLKERLDWVFTNLTWLNQFPSFTVRHELKFNSDHRIVVVNTNPSPERRIFKKPFSYQIAWSLENDFKDIIKEAWHEKNWIQGLQIFQTTARNWHDTRVGNFSKKKRELIRRLEGIDKSRRDNLHTGLYRLEKKLWNEYHKVATQEELFWFQRSRCNWLQSGDRNTRFFHASAVIKRRKFRVDAIQNDAGEWVEDQQTAKMMAHDFFLNLYSRDDSVKDPNELCSNFPVIDTHELHMLAKKVTAIEIKNAAFAMGAFKAPGPDGIQAHFFQSQWDIVGPIICDFIEQCFDNPSYMTSINKSRVVLIPKVDNPISLRDFRPISLCNVSFKIITKVLANRFRGVMSTIVGPEQCSFIAGRSTCDNILIAQEIIHSMRMRGRKKGFVAIKIDMEKAFDRLDWGFIKNTLVGLQLADNLINLIMACVSTTSMSILWNGEGSPCFTPSRGVRQGDPLSPYIFVLCMERLGHLIRAECEARRWKPFSFKRSGPHISHLFFADDLILFTEASPNQMEEVRRVMKNFCETSGHRINLAKSRMFCSLNVNFNRAMELSQLLGIGLTSDLGKYLGVPVIHKRVTRTTYYPIVQKTKKKLSAWKSKFLTIAGRSVLIKSVLSALPSYCMQSTLLPICTINELDKISRRFLWSQEEEGKKMHLIAWEKVTQAKKQGGLGFKNLRRQNKAFIMKLCWSLLTKKHDLWVQCLWAKYNCGNLSLPKVSKKRSSSPAWKAITQVWEKFLSGVGKKVNNGGGTKFWHDLWLPMDRPLMAFVADPSVIIEEDTVRDQLLGNGQWDIDKWRGILPFSIINTISKIPPPSSNLPDCFIWRPATDGCFSVKSAYNYLSDHERPRDSGFWASLWRWQIPEKVKFFMWQVAHERLVTNSLRAKRGLTDDNICPFPCNSEETVTHIIRDCDRAKDFWKQILRTNLFSKFFSGNLQAWLNWNVRHNPANRRFQNLSWPRVFSLGCWILWTTRCKFLFNGVETHTREMIHLCNYLLMENSSNQVLTHKIFQLGRIVEESWTPPPVDTVRIDVDGSVRHYRQAACGGVIRNSHGHWLMGFHKSLGQHSPIEAEILAIMVGLTVGHQMGFQRIHLYSDSIEAINILMRDCPTDHPLRDIITDTRDLLFQDCSVQLHYSPRENIFCADFMAKHGHEDQHGPDLVLLPTVPTSCLSMYLRDRSVCHL
ncbi:hypothetical protein QN277_006806 [Acacia crassicarpa]|uniref:Reverse transcriptase domain-containing protein n=1 Tax=Acacia crassicarpa TaxID=499986 RepID=A0AAE1M9S1_9FABA|nr:hypothetical protein QN277_006806 [Acacia crassicarpa]